MKSVKQAAWEWIENESISKDTYEIERAIRYGVALAETWIECSKELPQIKDKPYQVLVKRNDGSYITMWVGEGSRHLLDGYDKWRPINRK